ncbi:6-phosphogluconate dehydrogenase [Fomitopsis serialis]|uniref:6-phosphogluconate dehydrogenase n=1 Tax=Fomitopsis serialis TaxID=139415 RepID=UPI002007EEA3|nr:6-phosphogluconate dehydrogenase [Neoantrodia serialis]KAH9924378.1 6-phosphogluconate dehydrogenase [Neoantrodia serialis]
MSPPTLAVVAAGAMGAAVARRLTTAGCTVLTNLEGRSQATRERAASAGMLDVPMPELAARSQWVLSILPPSDALAFAARYKDVAPAQSKFRLAFADCNAVSPETVKKIAALFDGSGIGFVDAGIIGGPPKEGYDPVFYASAAPEDSALLDEFSGLSTGVGDASALKMSYAGISKGIIGLTTTMILAAHASSPATAQALVHELHSSQPQVLQRITTSVPAMLPKAYRWVGEMEEISSFVGDGEGQIHQGLARLYERVERSLKEEKEGGPAEDVKVLRSFVDDAKAVIGGQK